MSGAKYLGIDLGTSNSAVAVFEEGKVETILNSLGEVNTPSVVRVLNNSIVVGAKAQRQLYADIQNTFKEFKRLMGTETLTKADRHGHRWSADELSAEVLKALKQAAERQTGYYFDKAVITVPALFELPQSNATSNAARLAGFEQVELLPEPIASGLASGWTNDQSGAWLVYDLGGGTFDVSLLESRDGLLRVVGHDGDNFLGGRDIDREIVNWIEEELRAKCDVSLDHLHPDYPAVLRHMQTAAEKAKIRLSTVEQSVVELEFVYEGNDILEDLYMDQNRLRSLCEGLIQRSIDICKRLVKTQGLDLDNVSRVVLVGGPAHMPIIQEEVSKQIAPLAVSNVDPMSLVARGAALYSASVNLACNENVSEPSAISHQIWLQYPSVCTELDPTIMGRILDDHLSLAYIKIKNIDTQWNSDFISIEDGVFLSTVPIKAAQKNSFKLHGFDKRKNQITVSHPHIDIVHGITMSDPPLSRSIGVALADGSVKTFIERGAPLPAKRSFEQFSADTLIPGSTQKLSIPIVQGERRQARFCRQVGHIEIQATKLEQTLQVGTAIEITIEVNRGGGLKAQAYISSHGKLIEGIANLVIADASVKALQSNYQKLNTRVSIRFHEAFREKNEVLIQHLEPLSIQLVSLQSDMKILQNDTDSCQRVLRNLMEIEAEIEQIESQDQIQILIDECEATYFGASSMVNNYGDAADRKILEDCARYMEKSFKLPRQEDLERLIERLNSVRHSAHQKSPEFWIDVFLHWASYVNHARNPKKATKIVESGKKAIEKNDIQKLKSLTHSLCELIPNQHRGNGGGNYDSGVY